MAIVVPHKHTCGQALRLVFLLRSVVPASGETLHRGATGGVGQIVEATHPPDAETVARMYEKTRDDEIVVNADVLPLVCPTCHGLISSREVFPPRARIVRFLNDVDGDDDDVDDADAGPDDVPV